MKLLQPRFAKLIRRVCNVTGSNESVDNVSTTVNAILALEDPAAAENFKHRDDRLCGAIGQATGAAGTVPRVMLAPRIANLLTVVEAIVFSQTVAGELQLAITQNTATFDAAVLQGNAVADTRWQAAQPAVTKCRADTPAASSGANYGGLLVGVNDPCVLPVSIVLINGFVLEVARTTVGVATLDVHFQFRERFADPSELTT